MPKSLRYRDAGVNIDEADRAVSSIKKFARQTFTRGVLTDIGSFGASYQLARVRKTRAGQLRRWRRHQAEGRFPDRTPRTVGQDLVNHCVNDIAVQGARAALLPGLLRGRQARRRSRRRSRRAASRAAARENGCALIGGETAEMPGMYADGEYDLAGFIVGAADANRLLTGARIREGDVLLGLPSTGLHTNGYSLARKLLVRGRRLRRRPLCRSSAPRSADALLAVHRSYLKPIRALHDARPPPRRRPHHRRRHHRQHSAHAARGPRRRRSTPVLDRYRRSSSCCARIGNIPEDDYRRTFNLGVGMILAVPAAQRQRGGEGPRASWARSRSASARWSAQAQRPRVEYR